MKVCIFSLVCAVAVFLSNSCCAAGQEPGWTSRVLKVGEDRERTNAIDIRQRPYRPLHFYGNTLRRIYYRGNPLPTPRDLGNTVRYVIRRAD